MLDKRDDGKDKNSTVTCPIVQYIPRNDEMNENTAPFTNPVPDETISPVTTSLPGLSGECSFVEIPQRDGRLFEGTLVNSFQL
jgi:hypothetical protein